MMKNVDKIVMDIIKNGVPKNLKNEIRSESNLIEDLGFDSLKLLGMSVEFEKKANFDVLRASEEVDFSEIRTVKDITDTVLKFQK